MLRPRYGDKAIKCGFVPLPHGHVHFRMCGDGPPVLALHESPRSSISLLPLLKGLSDRFTVIAIDTPGYGFSDPLPGAAPEMPASEMPAPEMEDYVAAVEAVLEALGLKQVGLYGTHTGAAIAVAFANAHPHRVAALVMDGYGIFTAIETENFISKYLTPFEPAWDGSHIMHLWSRIKDLYMWFPWYDRSAARRLALDPPEVKYHQLTAIGFLQAGADYGLAYRRAAEHPANALLRSLKVPTTIMSREDDLLHSHLGRVEPGSSAVVKSVPADNGPWLAALTDALSPALLLPAPRLPETQDKHKTQDNHGIRRHLTRIGDGYLHWRDGGAVDAPVILLLHDLPHCTAALMDEADKLCADFRVIAIDLPGCGQSDPLLDAEALVAPLEALLAGEKISPQLIVGVGASALLASELAERLGHGRAIAVAAPAWASDHRHIPSTNPLPEFHPNQDGTHMTAAWFRLRDMWFYESVTRDQAPTTRKHADSANDQDLHARYRAFCLGPECRDVMAAALDLARLGHRVGENLPAFDCAAIAAKAKG